MKNFRVLGAICFAIVGNAVTLHMCSNNILHGRWSTEHACKKKKRHCLQTELLLYNPPITLASEYSFPEGSKNGACIVQAILFARQ